MIRLHTQTQTVMSDRDDRQSAVNMELHIWTKYDTTRTNDYIVCVPLEATVVHFYPKRQLRELDKKLIRVTTSVPLLPSRPILRSTEGTSAYIDWRRDGVWIGSKRGCLTRRRGYLVGGWSFGNGGRNAGLWPRHQPVRRLGSMAAARAAPILRFSLSHTTSVRHQRVIGSGFPSQHALWRHFTPVLWSGYANVVLKNEPKRFELQTSSVSTAITTRDDVSYCPDGWNDIQHSVQFNWFDFHNLALGCIVCC